MIARNQYVLAVCNLVVLIFDSNVVNLLNNIDIIVGSQGIKICFPIFFYIQLDT